MTMRMSFAMIRQATKENKTIIAVGLSALLIILALGRTSTHMESYTTPVGEARHAMAQIDTVLEFVRGQAAVDSASDRRRDSLLAVIAERLSPASIKVSTKVELVSDTVATDTTITDSLKPGGKHE